MVTEKIKNQIIKILLKLRLKGYYRKSYSQFGEDMVLSSFLDVSKKGFYVDIGAYHPEKFSNTYFYYKKGWCGLNIDARPGSMVEFKKRRPRDINIESGVSNNTGLLKYHMYKEPAYNTFSEKNYSRLKNKGIEPYKIEKVSIDRLENILKDNLPENREIDFVSIDVEGHTIEVLESNNWSKYRPKYILVETHNDDKKDNIDKFLIDKGYNLVSIANITSIYKQKD